MTYYSTGLSKHLPKRGKPIECNNAITVDILLKKGCIVETLAELTTKVETVNVVKEQIIEVPKKKKGNPNFGKKKV